jgi:hypothetical protein
MRAQMKVLVVVALAAGVSACDVIGVGDRESDVGIIEWQMESASAMVISADPLSIGDPHFWPALEAPDTAQAGVPFDVIVSTYGASCCWRADGARVDRAPMSVTITPYDRVPATHANGEPLFCTAALVRLQRTVSVTFADVGTAMIRVEGRVVTNGDVRSTEPGTIEKAIVVR